MIPYGRGGAGFSVLDVTKPTVTVGAQDAEGNYEPGSGPVSYTHLTLPTTPYV